MSNLSYYSMSFNGELLNRGFWLYVWDIHASDSRHLYVGRTGDQSSPNAASPFNRIGQHLDQRKKAKANSLTKQLRRIGLDPASCSFEMIAIGPIFPEQSDFEAHVPFRNRTAALETALAQHLKARGYDIIGNHPPAATPDADLWEQVVAI